MAELYAITGVMAAGKSTVAELLAQRFEKGVHLRGDVFRRMIVSGREEMCAEPSEEAVRQLHLRYRLAVDAAKAYFEAGFSVVLQDNYYGQEWANLLERFSGYPVPRRGAMPGCGNCAPAGSGARQKRLHGLCHRAVAHRLFARNPAPGLLAG